MEFWFKKILVSLTIYFGVTGICFADENQDLNWHKAHYQELKQSVEEYIQNNSLYPLLEQAPLEVYLAKEPYQMHKGDNFYLTSIIGIIEQGETELFAFFCVYHQINPSWAQTLFMYTANDELHMPSMKLLLDVKTHTFMQQKKIFENHNLHIITTNADSKGDYTQDWVFFNENESQTISITFSSDGALGTNFTFLNN